MKTRQNEMLGPLKRLDKALDESQQQMLLLAEQRRPDVYQMLQNLPQNMFANDHKISSAGP